MRTSREVADAAKAWALQHGAFKVKVRTRRGREPMVRLDVIVGWLELRPLQRMLEIQHPTMLPSLRKTYFHAAADVWHRRVYATTRHWRAFLSQETTR